MNHPRRSHFERYVLGDLDVDARLALDEHVAVCERCAALLAREREIDAWVVQTSAEALPDGTSRRMFDALWERIDEDAQPPVTTTIDAGTSWWRGMRRAAAMLVVGALAWWAVVSFADAPQRSSAPEVVESGAPTSAPVPEPPNAEPPSPEATIVETTPPGSAEPTTWELRLAAALDNPGTRSVPAWGGDDATSSQRLDAVRQRVAQVLLAADDAHPDDDAQFAAACALAWDELRPEGWAVDQLVRNVLLRGRDGAAAEAALRAVLVDPTAEMTLARVLDDDRWADAVLAGLLVHPRDLGAARALGRAVAQRLDDEERVPMAVDVLVALRGETLLRDEVEEIITRALRSPSPVRTKSALALVRAVPARLAVGAWIDLADVVGANAAARGFEGVLAASETEAVAALGHALSQPRRRETAIQWVFEQGLAELVPQLVRVASDRQDAELLDALGALADARAARPLFEAWREHRGRPLDGRLADALVALLVDDAEARSVLASSTRAHEVGDLIDLMTHAIDSAPGLDRRSEHAELCADVLSGVVVDPTLDAGRRARTLGALARHGHERHADRLLEALVSRPDDALGWITAATLAPEATYLTFQRVGGDVDDLTSAVRDIGAWPTFAVAPPTRVLRRIERALDRLDTTPMSRSKPVTGDDE